MGNIEFRMAALTNVGRVRTNNEDNFLVDSDLSDDKCFFTQNEQKDLGKKGALLVVADGMGGMNAGEVASRLAVETIQEYFSAERLTEDVIQNRQSIERYMKMTIVAADKAIKERSKKDEKTTGMGTTVVMAWLLKDKVYVAWCGDSRAYAWHPQMGLRQLSKDHSYVQELVDSGKLDEENAFDHPDSNIITRSLGDPRKVAEPDFREEELYQGEVILLCSDGLCGMIRDREMEVVLRENPEDMKLCGEALIAAALQAGGHDNVTVTLCRVVVGGKTPVVSTVDHTHKEGEILENPENNKKMWMYLLGGILILGLGIGIGCYISRPVVPVNKNPEQSGPQGQDSLRLLEGVIRGAMESVGKPVTGGAEGNGEGSRENQDGQGSKGVNPSNPLEQQQNSQDTSKQQGTDLTRVEGKEGKPSNLNLVNPEETGPGEQRPAGDTTRKENGEKPQLGENPVSAESEQQPPRDTSGSKQGGTEEGK